MKLLIAVLLFVGVTLGALSPAFGYRDLETGTFITRDPAGFVDGPNLYTYVRQNPWTMWDPWGLSPYQAAQYNSAGITGQAYDPLKSTRAFAGHVSNSPELQSEGRRAVKFVLAVDMAVLTASSFSAFIGEVFEKLTGLPVPNESQPEESKPEGETPRENAEDEGVVYEQKDKNASTAEEKKPYIGQAESEERYNERQKEHARENPDADFDYTIKDRGTKGTDLDRKEEDNIRRGGGPTRKSTPQGGTRNKRSQMSEKRYREAGGTEDDPTRQ